MLVHIFLPLEMEVVSQASSEPTHYFASEMDKIRHFKLMLCHFLFCKFKYYFTHQCWTKTSPFPSPSSDNSSRNRGGIVDKLSVPNISFLELAKVVDRGERGLWEPWGLENLMSPPPNIFLYLGGKINMGKRPVPKFAYSGMFKNGGQRTKIECFCSSIVLKSWDSSI